MLAKFAPISKEEKKIKQTSPLKVVGALDSSDCFSLQLENSALPAKHTCYHWYFLFAYLCITVPCFPGDISYLVLRLFLLLLMLCFSKGMRKFNLPRYK